MGITRRGLNQLNNLPTGGGCLQGAAVAHAGSSRPLSAAEREHERDRLARASVARQEAEAALHYPGVDRTTIYDDMRRAVRLVGDENILWYESSSGSASRLKLDLEAGDLPAGILGHRTRHKRR